MRPAPMTPRPAGRRPGPPRCGLHRPGLHWSGPHWSDPHWSDPHWSDPHWSDPHWSDPWWSGPRPRPGGTAGSPRDASSSSPPGTFPGSRPGLAGLAGPVAAALAAAAACRARRGSPGGTLPGHPGAGQARGPTTTSRASPSSATIRVRPSWLWEMSRVPPPGREPEGLRPRARRRRDGLQRGAVEGGGPAAGRLGQFQGPAATRRGGAGDVHLPGRHRDQGAARLEHADPGRGLATRHSWKAAVLLTGRRSATSFSVLASVVSAGAGSRT